MKLENKTILVVGAAGLLGRSIVGELVSQGASVIAVDRDLASLQQAFKGEPKISVLHGDISDKESIASMFAAADAFGGCDGAVNTAYPRNKNYGRKFFDVTLDDFNENVSLHLGAYFLFMQQSAAFALKSDREFSLVNLSSIYGVMAPSFDVYEGTPMTMPVEYAAIKSALLHLNSYVTAFTKGSRFRVNSVSPGGIADGQPADFTAKYAAKCRKKGMLDPQDITGTISYLLSNESRYVCGQNIVVDDGFSV